MGLSSGTIIHQTSLINLKKILSDKLFKVSYSVEEFIYTKKTSESTSSSTSYIHVFPMISFSEIPVNSLQFHLKRYGDCIIGLKKKWALSNKLNPVHYCSKFSELTNSLINTYMKFDLAANGGFDVMGKDNEHYEWVKGYILAFKHLEHQLAHTKNYSGKVKTKSYEDDNYYFSEEKEWRYVPFSEVEGGRLSLNPEYYEEDKKGHNERIGRYTLEFDYNDVNFIIVDSDVQKRDIISQLKRDGIYINIFTNEEIKQNFFGYKNPSIEEYEVKKERDKLLEEKEGL